MFLTSRPGPIAAPAVSTLLVCTILTDRHDCVRLGPASSDFVFPVHPRLPIMRRMKLKWLIWYLKYRRYILPGIGVVAAAAVLYCLFLRNR